MYIRLSFLMFFISILFWSCRQNTTATNIPKQVVIDSIPEPKIEFKMIEPKYEIHDPVKIASDSLQNKSEFEYIISQIPVTPLPFGVQNLQDIDCSYPAESLLDIPLEFDTENRYGLNNYFYEHEELDPRVEHDGRCMPNIEDNGGDVFFSRRLPNLNTGEYVLLFYYTKPESIRVGIPNTYEYYMRNWTSSHWLIVVCQPTGKIVYVDTSIFSSDNYIRLSYIDKDYNIHTRHYQTPVKRSTVNDDEVSDDIIDQKLTILFLENSYKLERPEDKNSFSETGRWVSMNNGHLVSYRWVNNKPIDIKRIK